MVPRQQQGFTLVEIIVGIVTLGIALTILSTLLFPQAKRGAEPILQMRASELGIALMSEIRSQSFDENSDRSGGGLRCGETGAPACTLPANLGDDGEDRASFNDVDDYHQLQVVIPNITNTLNEDLSSRYPGFSYAIDVCYSNNVGVCQAGVTNFKRTQVTITTPLGQDFDFTGIRGNF
ncbi:MULTISPECIES: type II secretion system protein [Gammaproteobacteria]|uniref:type II secretion system protein n=1 Tax=Gammaproteobacteria TaxID=1236 RepID=UPI000DD0C6DF|nr:MULTISPECIES: type II secretion system protein [Gammaproteobacteria]RTE86377.1 type II secretion system protein [Aliidiomarina sp. B3213]TCZ91725.1 type II secretion system protein [Lysobacter sp. N42]